MSIFPIFTSILIRLLLVGIFCWKVGVLFLVFVLLAFCLVRYLYDIFDIYFSYEAGFWLFVFREAVIFRTLIFCCLFFDLGFYERLSSALELPFLGCFLLLGSRITVTAFHHVLGWRWAWVFLFLTIMLGTTFVFLQMIEMKEAFMRLVDRRFYASRFCTVGLHFRHVIVGIAGLVVILVVGEGVLGFYRCSVITWYWHFVDYVWLFVYTFVYVC